MDIGAIRNTEEAMVVGISDILFVGVLVKMRQVVVTLMEEMVGALFWVNVLKDRHTGVVIRLRNHVGGENNFPVFVIMA